MIAGTVAGLWRYPVKSMRGEELSAVEAGERGLVHDRGWALLDRESGLVASAKLPRLWWKLLACRAEAGAGDGAGAPATVRVTLPDGRVVVAGEAAADVALTEALERPVTLAAMAPEGATIARYWPDVAELPLRDTATTGAIGLGAPPGTFFDYAPLHLLTTATLAHLRALAPDGDFDLRRFRPNLVIAPPEGTEGLVENGWVGRALLLGETVRLRVTNPSPRCIVPTLPQGELPRDPGILRAVARHNRPPVPVLGGVTLPSLGVYAVVERGGVVHRGDAVWIEE